MSTKSAPFALFCACVAGVLLSTMAVYPQSQATTGNIEGRVLDPKNAAVPGATVSATNQQTGLRSIRFTENLRVRLIVEAFNLFNRSNVATVNNTFFVYSGGSAGTLSFPSAAAAFATPRTFGSPASGTTTFATPRQVQLAIKFDF